MRTDPRIRVRPLPECKAPAPKPACCGDCEGEGAFFGLEGCEPVELCASCGGTGEGSWVPPCEFRMEATHSTRHRRCEFDPNAGRLRLTQGRKFQDYAVAEFAAEGPGSEEYGRVFAVEKAGDLLPDGSRKLYRVGCGRNPSCDCEGFTFASNPRANQRAHEAGGEVFPSWGCVHLDALVPLVRAGWFDMKREGAAA